MTSKALVDRDRPGEKPFIYVCSLRRTGSTVVSEALTLFPYSFIFREPLLGRQKFRIKAPDREFFTSRGVDLRAYAERWEKDKPRSFVQAFKEQLLPELQRICPQLGIKEIRNRGWKDYVEHFPNLRVVLTGRDPRDIFLSLHDRVAAGTASWKGALTPQRVAAHLSREFEHQLAISEAAPHFKVRYEDFCTDADVQERLLQFVESPIPHLGAIGKFNSSRSERRAEFNIHQDEITAKRVERWKSECDEQLRDAAYCTFDLLTSYCKFWKYTAT